MIVLLDSGPLGVLSNPNPRPKVEAGKEWVKAMVGAGHRVLVPAIADYEIRRELCRSNSHGGLAALDALRGIGFVSLTDEAIRRACVFWADARNHGIPTADLQALDGDVILAGQAATLRPQDWGVPGATVIVATTNVGHLDRYVTARLWTEIDPDEF